MAPRIQFPIPDTRTDAFPELVTAEFRNKFSREELANQAAIVLVSQSQSIVQSELSAHAGQDSRALGFLGADVAAMALLPTLSAITAEPHWWWILVALVVAVLLLGWSVIRWTVGSGGYNLGPAWWEYVAALPQAQDALEINLTMVRELTGAIRSNAQLFNRKNGNFNLALVFNGLAAAIALLVFGFHL